MKSSNKKNVERAYGRQLLSTLREIATNPKNSVHERNEACRMWGEIGGFLAPRHGNVVLEPESKKKKNNDFLGILGGEEGE
jgi:hypothetical protein